MEVEDMYNNHDNTLNSKSFKFTLSNKKKSSFSWTVIWKKLELLLDSTYKSAVDTLTLGYWATQPSD